MSARRALEVINSSSGRSWPQLISPQDVITGKFDYGFALRVMSKDCKMTDVMDVHFPEASLIKEVSSIMEKRNSLCGSRTNNAVNTSSR